MPVSFPATDTVVGTTIRHHRRRKGILLIELAQSLRISAATLSRWERGREFVPMTRREQIAAALDIDPTTLGEPGAIEVTSEEQGLLTAYRRMPPTERVALRGLIAEFVPTQERASC